MQQKNLIYANNTGITNIQTKLDIFMHSTKIEF